MKSKNLILTSLLLAMAYLINQIFPPFFMAMKPDVFLSIMFIVLLLNENTMKNVILIGFTSGVLTAFATTFPGGQIPNFVEKIFTALFVYFIIKIIKNKFNNNLKVVTISILGTIFSGFIFLLLCYILVGLPAQFTTLFLTVVIPATFFNTIWTLFLYKIIIKSLILSRSI